MARRFNETLLVSSAEATLFRQLAPESAERVHGVANGVDADFFSPARDYANPFAAQICPAVFTGAMDYRPNIEAVAWFADHVLPAMMRIEPRFEFWIVGANPAPAVRRLATRPGVNVTGRVDDVRPYVFHAAAVVAPLLTARGIQNKVLEAMAMAKPVVATPQAQEGIDAVVGEELLVAGDPAAFAAQLQIALSPRGTVIGQRARKRVQSDYSWTRSLSAIDALLESDAGIGPAAAAVRMSAG
jgi:sugar transferase (PEP-CTERM/EpsH1 system associated)